MTSTQALMGSPLYMSPEQLRSSKNVDGRTDIWSMGIILYEMLAGAIALRGRDAARDVREDHGGAGSCPPRGGPHVPVALDAVVMRCLEKEPTVAIRTLRPWPRRWRRSAGRGPAAAQRVGRVVPGKPAEHTRLGHHARVAPAASRSVGKTNAAFSIRRVSCRVRRPCRSPLAEAS